MSEYATVYVVEDDSSLRDALVGLLESVNYKVMPFQNAELFLQNYAPNANECLVLDIRMPKMSGLELQKILKEKKIVIPIVFISGHGDIEMAVTAIKEGAIDFITKPFRHQQLLDVVNKALAIDLVEKKKQKKITDLAQLKQRLTARELEVMDKMLYGKLSKEIGEELGISPNTVDTHRANILKKMEISSLSELIQLVSAHLHTENGS